MEYVITYTVDGVANEIRIPCNVKHDLAEDMVAKMVKALRFYVTSKINVRVDNL
jgi:hypothetical protein